MGFKHLLKSAVRERTERNMNYCQAIGTGERAAICVTLCSE